MAPAQELFRKSPTDVTQTIPALSVLVGIFAFICVFSGTYILARALIRRARANAKPAYEELCLPSPAVLEAPKRRVFFRRFSLPTLVKTLSPRVSRVQDPPPARTIAEHLDMDFACRGITPVGPKETENKPSVSLVESLTLRYLAFLRKVAERKPATTDGSFNKAGETCQPPAAPKLTTKPVMIEINTSVPLITISLPSSDHITREFPISSDLDTAYLSPTYSPPPVYSAFPPAEDIVIDAGTRAHRARSHSRASLRPASSILGSVFRPRPKLGLVVDPITVAPGKPSPREGWF